MRLRGACGRLLALRLGNGELLVRGRAEVLPSLPRAKDRGASGWVRPTLPGHSSPETHGTHEPGRQEGTEAGREQRDSGRQGRLKL